MKISEIQRGERFSFSSFRWLAIEPTDSGTYALLDSVPELLKRRPFANLSTRRGKDLSDWKIASPAMCSGTPSSRSF